jgi:spermidine synthase
MRRLHLVLGSTGFAVATVVAAYMGGLALGSYLGGRWANRFSRPLLVYGLLELGVGAYALLVPSIFGAAIPIYKWLWATFHLSFYPFSLFRFFLAVLILLVPTTFMGATLPIMARYIVRNRAKIGSSVGLLYALNTFGAVAGSYVSGFLLLPHLGEWHGLLAAAAGNGTIAVAIVLYSLIRKADVLGEEGAPEPPVEVEEPPDDRPVEVHFPSTRWVVLIAFGISGIASLAMQVAWTRLLSLLLGSSVYAFSIILTTFLAGLALGSFLCSRIVGRTRNPVLWLGISQETVGLLALAGVFAYNVLFFLFILLFNKYTLNASIPYLFLAKFLMAGIVIFLPAFFMGAAFPLGVRAYALRIGLLGRRVGEIYSVNTLGAILGSFLGGFVLLPTLGLQRTVELGVVLYLCSAVALIWAVNPTRRILRPMGLGLAAFAVCVALFATPKADPQILSTGVYKYAGHFSEIKTFREFRERTSPTRRRVVFHREGITTTVTVIRFRKQVSVTVNGKVDGSSVGDMSTQVLSGHIPMLFAPEAKRVMVIGYGTGVTVGAIAQHEGVQVDCVELEGAIVDAGRYFAHVNHDTEALVAEGKVRIIKNDGRNILLASTDKFDMIVSEPSNPWISGSSKLFTHEFFQLAASRLNEGGVFAQWVQLYGMDTRNVRSLIRTFREAFGRIVIFQPCPATDLLMLGRKGGDLTVSRERLEALFRAEKPAADLALIDIHSPAELAAYFLAGDEQAIRFIEGEGDLPPLNTDDNSFIEFSAPRTIFIRGRGSSIQEEIEKGYPGPLTVFQGFTGKEAADFLAQVGEKARDLRTSLARQLCEKSLAIAPTAAGHALRAKLRWKNRKTSRRELELGLALQPTHRVCVLRRVELAMEENDWVLAVRLLRARLREDPSDWPLRYKLGVCLSFLARQLESERKKHLVPVAPAVAPPALGLALVLQNAVHASVIREFSAVESARPPQREVSRLPYYRAMSLRDLGDAEGAIRGFRAYLRWDPADRLARRQLVDLLKTEGRMAEVREAEGPENDPERAKTLWKSARGLFGLGDFESASEGAFLTLENAPFDADLGWRVGYAFMVRNRLPEACEAWKRALRYLPGDVDLGTYLAYSAELVAERASSPEIRAHWTREAARVMANLAKRENDAAQRNEYENRAKTLAAAAGGERGEGPK